MRSRQILAPAVAMFALGATLALGSGGSFQGKKAPDLGELEWVQGQEIPGGLGGMKGKVVMLEFFATW